MRRETVNKAVEARSSSEAIAGLQIATSWVVRDGSN